MEPSRVHGEPSHQVRLESFASQQIRSPNSIPAFSLKQRQILASSLEVSRTSLVWCPECMLNCGGPTPLRGLRKLASRWQRASVKHHRGAKLLVANLR